MLINSSCLIDFNIPFNPIKCQFNLSLTWINMDI
jgi:hypothetical protein